MPRQPGPGLLTPEAARLRPPNCLHLAAHSAHAPQSVLSAPVPGAPIAKCDGPTHRVILPVTLIVDLRPTTMQSGRGGDLPEGLVSWGRDHGCVHAAVGRQIFVSYRHDDAAYPAGWLVDRLAGRFGAGRVFKDVDSIQLGDDFVEDIMAAVGSCAVLLAVIGVGWLTATGEDGRRRLDDPGDFVRLEIEAALARDVRVIPVLVDGARMPRAADLPASLEGLVRRQALELNPGSFDTSRLLRMLDSALAGTRPATRPTLRASGRPARPERPIGVSGGDEGRPRGVRTAASS